METFIGQIILFAGSYTPVGFAACDGALLPISNYTALFSLLGTTYGGDGTANFALPKMSASALTGAKEGEGARYLIAIEGIYPPRN